MATKRAKLINVQQSISDFRTANPKIRRALDIYKRAHSYTAKGAAIGSYKTSTSTKLSNIFTTR
jgi:hypothetical protein